MTTELSVKLRELGTEVQVEIDFQNKLRKPFLLLFSLIFSMSCSLSYNANSHFRILVVRQSIKAFKFTFKALNIKFGERA